MAGKVELVVDAKAIIGEGPCWDHRTGTLHWVDIEGKKVFFFDPVNGENRQVEFEQQITAIVPCVKPGEAILATDKGFCYLDLETGDVENIVDPEWHLPENRFNDGKCDANGRFWAGSMNLNDKDGEGALYCLDGDGTLTKKLDRVSISNGLAWSPDNNYMYHIDTPMKKVVRYRYHLDTGEIGTAVEVINFTEEVGFPDGMTIDAEGMLWIAHWGGSKVSRWDPNLGMKLKEINLPVLNATSCTFGGDGLDELYITTARSGMDEEQVEKYPLSGGLFKVKTGVKGIKTAFYGGHR
ncbi:MAG: SMP-30/gluconolactonase/LRE family protein [Bacillus sp. (in: firmicutes)]